MDAGGQHRILSLSFPDVGEADPGDDALEMEPGLAVRRRVRLGGAGRVNGAVFVSYRRDPVASQPVSGSVSLSATALDFRNGSASTRTVTYTNNTSSTVTFIQASIDSGKYGQTNNCGEVLPGKSCTATVTWYRSNTGSNSATFRMTSTAPNSPHLVTLTSNSKVLVVKN